MRDRLLHLRRAVPANALFGHTSIAGLQVLCRNPAALGGGSAPLDSVFPTEPFAPGTILGLLTPLVGFTVPQVSTPWVEAEGPTTATAHRRTTPTSCRSPNRTERHLNPIPDATWGLHLVDTNIAFGDQVDLIRSQAKAFKHASKHHD